MLNNQSLVDINTLPREILSLIFSYLSPNDLLNKGLVKKLWQQVTQEPAIWQNLIRQHFPYLAKNRLEGYQKTPKAIFIEEFQRICNTFAHSPNYASLRPLILASLRGDMNKIEKSEIPAASKEDLYAYAAINGHLAAYKKLTSRALKGQAFKLAVENDYLPAVRMIFVEAGQALSPDQQGEGVRLAATRGFLDVVKFLLIHPNQEISAEHKGMALENAATNGHHDVVQVLLTSPGQEISSNRKGFALLAAAQGGHSEIFQTILTADGEQSPTLAKGVALKMSAVLSQLGIVTALLRNAGQEILTKDKVEALTCAAELGHLEVVQAILNHCGKEILAADRDLARKMAANKGYLQVVQVLSTSLIDEKIPGVSFHGHLRSLVSSPSQGAESIEQPPLPPLTSQSSTEKSGTQSMLDQEIPTYTTKRREETTKNGTDEEEVDEELPRNKRAKLG